MSDLRLARVHDAPGVAELHVARIGEGFLATLGPAFLTRLYARIARSADAFVVVAPEGRDVLGFVAVAEDTGRLYRTFVRKDGVAAGFAALPAILRAPRPVWETLRYGTRAGGTDALPRAEILSVAVAATAQGRGLGGALVQHALHEMTRRGVDEVQVVTAATNEAAQRMYRRAGFEVRAHTEVHRGVAQEVLVWRS